MAHDEINPHWQENIRKVRLVRVRFEDCWTGQEREGVIMDYISPLCWKIKPDRSYVRDNGEFAYAEDRTVRCVKTGKSMAELVEEMDAQAKA